MSKIVESSLISNSKAFNEFSFSNAPPKSLKAEVDASALSERILSSRQELSSLFEFFVKYVVKILRVSSDESCSKMDILPGNMLYPLKIRGRISKKIVGAFSSEITN